MRTKFIWKEIPPGSCLDRKLFVNFQLIYKWYILLKLGDIILDIWHHYK